MNRNFFVRRSIVLGGAGALVLPQYVFGQVDPATAAAVISAAVDLFKSASAAQAEDKWKNDVTERLQRIEGKLDQVLVEFKDLRIFIRQEEQERDLREFHSSIYGHKFSVDQILSVKIGAPEKSRLLQLSGTLQEDLNRFPQIIYNDGPGKLYPLYSGYSALAYGIATLISISRIAGVQKEIVSKQADDLIANFLQPAVDVAKYRSFAWALNVSKEASDTTITQLNNSPKSGCVGYNAECHEPGGGGGPGRHNFVGLLGAADGQPKVQPNIQKLTNICTYQNRYLNLAGDPSGGYRRGDLENRISGVQPACSPFPGHTPATNDTNRDEVIASEVLAEYNKKSETVRQEIDRQVTLTKIISDIQNSIVQLRMLKA